MSRAILLYCNSCLQLQIPTHTHTHTTVSQVLSLWPRFSNYHGNQSDTLSRVRWFLPSTNYCTSNGVQVKTAKWRSRGVVVKCWKCVWSRWKSINLHVSIKPRNPHMKLKAHPWLTFTTSFRERTLCVTHCCIFKGLFRKCQWFESWDWPFFTVSNEVDVAKKVKKEKASNFH